MELLLHSRLTEIGGKGQVEWLQLTDEKTGVTTKIEDEGCGIFVYAAGDICVKQVRQAATAVADGAVAAINAAQWIAKS